MVGLRTHRKQEESAWVNRFRVGGCSALLVVYNNLRDCDNSIAIYQANMNPPLSRLPQSKTGTHVPELCPQALAPLFAPGVVSDNVDGDPFKREKCNGSQKVDALGDLFLEPRCGWEKSRVGGKAHRSVNNQQNPPSRDGQYRREASNPFFQRPVHNADLTLQR